MRSWRTGKTHAVTTILDLYHDGSVPQQLRNDGLPLKRAWRASAKAWHEFLWARVIFRQQIGVYLFDKTPYNPALVSAVGIFIPDRQAHDGRCKY